MWDLNRTNPALLRPSMTVNFEDITRNPVSIAISKSVSVPKVEHDALPLFKVLASGLQASIQDEGRFQQTKMGVGSAGALDIVSMHSANRIVGNPPSTAVIEVLNGGLKLQCQNATVIAITGAKSEIQVKYNNSKIVNFDVYKSIALDCGDEVFIKTPQAGLRNYLAIRGGMDVHSVLNSYSFDSLAMLGPKPLQVNQYIYQGQASCSVTSIYESASASLPVVGDTVEVDICMGPRTNWFNAKSLELLCEQKWQVTTESNRVGLRLNGEIPLVREITSELESEATGNGALQVPPNGQPVLFMNDHPLTGGYPVIASVAKHHWNLVAQIPAGCFIKFKKIAEFIEIESENETTKI